MENLFEQIMKENFPNLAKEIDLQIQEAKRVPIMMDAERPTPRHIIIKMPKVKDKERILKTAREKHVVIYKGVPIRLSADFLKESFQARMELARNIQSHEKQGPTAKMTLPSKAII